jgi:non-specific serine/threonine protein kinase/serine/threonine-protein kinase
MENAPPDKLRHQLRGDLDNIVLMALRKEPQRRYSSVEQLATDIQRHLLNLPVSASKDTLCYRASKFILRHRTGALAAVALLITLLAGLTATIYEARLARTQQLRAERRFNDVRKLANSLMFEIHDSIRDLPGSTAARKLLVDRALEYLDSLSSEGGNDPSLMRELANAYERVGDVQGYFYSGNVGDTSGAMQSYRKALTIRQALAHKNPADNTAQSDLAASHIKMADALYSTGDKSGSLEQSRMALTIRQHLASSNPASEDASWNLLDTQRSVGDALLDIPDWSAAKGQYDQSLADCEKLAAAHPDSLRYRRMSAVLLNKIGFVYEQTNDVASAERNYQQALQTFQQLAAAYPTNTLVQRNLALAYLSTGDLKIARGDDRGINDLKQASVIADAIAAKDPANLRIERDVSLIDAHLGDAEKRRGNTKLALQYYLRGLAAAERRAISDPQNADAGESVANRNQNIGTLYAEMARDRRLSADSQRTFWQNAHSCFQKSLDYWQKQASGSNTKIIEELQQSLRTCDAALN